MHKYWNVQNHKMISNNAANDYFQNEVLPTVSEFLGDKTDLRRGRIAAIILYHMNDYAKESGMGTPCAALVGSAKLMFEVVRAAANASKHYNLKIPHIASKAEQIISEDNPGMFTAPFGTGVFAEANEVHLLLDEDKRSQYDGVKSVNLAEAILFMRDFWGNQFTQLS